MKSTLVNMVAVLFTITLVASAGVGYVNMITVGPIAEAKAAATQSALRAVLPPEKSSDFCHRIVLHGRAVCIARRPRCEACALAPYCRTFSGE